MDVGAVDQDQALAAFENIALGRREGKHLLFVAREVFRRLASFDRLSAGARGTYRRVLGRFPQKKSLSLSLTRHIEVVADSYGSLRWITQGAFKTAQVPISYFYDSMLVQETVLLSENLRDTALYKRMAQVGARIQGLGSIQIRAEGIGGGGSTTADEYSRYQASQRRLCLCIVDSDIKAPSGVYQDTARMVAEVDDTNQPLCEYSTTQVRELENTIPTTVLSAVSSGDRARMEAILFLERLESSSSAEARKYLDLKHGTKLVDLLSHYEGSPEHMYWSSQLPTLVSIAQLIDQRCARTQTCRSPTSCTCEVARGLGAHILDDALRWIRHLSIPKTLESLGPHTKAEWRRLGELILAWCCGSERLSAV